MQTSHASHSPVAMATGTLEEEEVPRSHPRPEGGAALLFGLLTEDANTEQLMHPGFICAPCVPDQKES